MTTFVILPPRELVEHAVHGFVEALLPGMVIPDGLWERIVEEVLSEAKVYSLHREDLPETDDLAGALADGFGAEAGDRVVELALPRGREAGPVRAWTLPGVSAAASGR
ncbi:MAG TPA: hypothetical protein VGJ05_18745 [Fimbriiglobus sp.]|jgi:hypothetical protein